jgi:hydrogenase expression/formation protein HypE
MSARARVSGPTITLAHGSGGKAMRDLVDDVFVGSFDNPVLAPLEDQARLDLAALASRGDRLAMTTDSHVVDPLFFPGGDIGRLAVCGTVNDLAVGGARPLYLSCAVIAEEGLPLDTLRRVAQSMRAAAEEAGVLIVTGDTKVVPRGAADQLFVTTTGIGVIPAGVAPGGDRLRPGDRIIASGHLGDHGITVLAARGGLELETELASDTRPLHALVEAMLAVCPDIHAMRDMTRGGLAAVSTSSPRLPAAASPSTRRRCRFAPRCAPPPSCSASIRSISPARGRCAPRCRPRLRNACSRRCASARKVRRPRFIGEVEAGGRPVVVARSSFGGTRVVDMLISDQLPRIC